eukprot:14176_1
MTSTTSKVELLSVPNHTIDIKTVRFTASNNDCKHENCWKNGIPFLLIGIPLIASNTNLYMFGLGIFLEIVGVMVIVTSCIYANGCSQTYSISFNDTELMVQVCRGRRVLHTIPYHEFKELDVQISQHEYCICRSRYSWGRGIYCAARVYIIHEDGQETMINDKLCINEEIVSAKCVVQVANQYYKTDRHEAVTLCVKEENEGQSNDDDRIAIGTCCCVDCENVYGVVIGHLPDDFYTIIDLFEMRQRRAYESNLTPITDTHKLNEINRLYQQYMKRSKPIYV